MYTFFLYTVDQFSIFENTRFLGHKEKENFLTQFSFHGVFYWKGVVYWRKYDIFLPWYKTENIYLLNVNYKENNSANIMDTT